VPLLNSRIARMPYFVYKVFGARRFERVEAFDHYRDAKQLARSMRQQLSEDADYLVRVIFASNDAEAVRLLAEKREPRPMGEE
jgi:hypothetical protein